MKVYDYLTLQLLKVKLSEYLDILDYLEEKFGIEVIIEDFYNLPFTPDLITKFFKGWEKSTNLNYKYKSFVAYFYSKNHYQLKMRHNMPIVLNDFIRDCILEKIELEM